MFNWLIIFIRRHSIYLVLFITALLLLYHIDKPFIGHHDWNGAFWGAVARNYVGAFQKIAGQQPIFDGVFGGDLVYYTNYPPLMPVLFTLSSLLFGINETSLRLVTVICSLIMIFSVYNIGTLLYSKRVGLIASMCVITTPMFLYFGKLPDHEPIVTSLITLALYWYLKQKSGAARDYLIFLVCIALAFLESWAPYFLFPFLFLDMRLFSPKKRRFTLLISVAILCIALHLLSIIHFRGITGLQTFFGSGISRMNSSSNESIIRFSSFEYMTTIARYSVIYFTRPLLLLACFWFAKSLVSLFTKNIQPSDRTLLLFLLPFVCFMLVFRNLVYIHDYKLFLLLPYLALAAARSIVIVSDKCAQFLIRNKPAVFSRTIAFIIPLIFVHAIATERLPYLRALLATSFNLPGVTLGRFLNEQTQESDKILVNSGQFFAFYDVFVRYYANRTVIGTDATLEDFLNNPKKYADYTHIAFVKDRTTDQGFREYISTCHQAQSHEEFTLFKIK